MNKLPSLISLLDETVKSCTQTQVKFQVRQLAAQEKTRRLLYRLYDRDPYTFFHCFRVAELVLSLGLELKLDSEELAEATLCGLFHDIGKIFTPDLILKKPGPLDAEEFRVMQHHPIDSQKLVESINSLKHIGITVRAHHERWDGKGYPDQLKDEKIPQYARLIFVCDTFDAMTSMRIYQKNRKIEEAYKELERCAGSQFDPKLVPAFIEAHKKLSESKVLRETLAA